MIGTLAVTLLAAAPVETLTLDAPTGDAVMLLARNAGLNLYASALSGRVKGTFPSKDKEALARDLLAQVQEHVSRREDFVFLGKVPPAKALARVDLGSGPRITSLWEKEITAGSLARQLSLSLRRPVVVAAPYDQETLAAVLSTATAEQAVVALAFFLGQPITVGADGAVAIGEPGAAVNRTCSGFSLSEWTRLSGFANGAYPFGLLQTGGVTCPAETGRNLRTADGELLRAVGPDDDGAMLLRFATGPKAGTFARVSFTDYQEIRGCDDITRDSKLKRSNSARSFAVLAQGLIECGLSRNTRAGEFEIIDIDSAGPYVRNDSKGAKSAVVQVTDHGIVAAIAPVQTK